MSARMTSTTRVNAPDDRREDDHQAEGGLHDRPADLPAPRAREAALRTKQERPEMATVENPVLSGPRRVRFAGGASPKPEWPMLNPFGPLDAIARIALVRQGIPAARVEEVAARLGLSKEKLYSAIGVARATVDRKIREGRLLSADESERLLGVMRLIGQVERMMEESGDPDAPPEYDPVRWLGEWLDDPNPALGGERPAALLDTADGRELVSNLLGSMQSGAYW